ncbi:MAG: hypothetical protein ACLR6B_13215 [Blautia sp.]
MMKRAAAIALAVALVGGSFGAGSYVSNHYGAVAQASETESESETEGTEASTVATASTADGTTYSVQEIVANAMPSMVAITNKGVQEVQRLLLRTDLPAGNREHRFRCDHRPDG